MQTPSYDEMIRDGLKFKAEINDPQSALSCFRTALYVLREQNIQRAKTAHSRKNEERAAYFMGIVEGIDQCITHPEKMIKKWESMLDDQIEAGVGNGSR